LSVIIYLTLVFILVYWVERPGLFFSKSLIIRPHPAEELGEWLKSFQWGQRGELKTQKQLPEYKFYTETIETILNLARRMGGNFQDALLFLRERLQSDLQFEKKLKELILGTWLQMGMMMFLTWAFILGALHITEISMGMVPLLMLLLWQVTGLIALPLVVRYFRQKYFGEIGVLWKMLYVLSSLSRVPLARSEVMTLAGVQHLPHIKGRGLLPLAHKLREVCKMAMREGGSYESEIKTLMDELAFQEKWYFELFSKRLMALKLALLSLFFLPSYLAFIFLLLGDLLKSM
jgi:hypothetical protein